MSSSRCTLSSTFAPYALGGVGFDGFRGFQCPVVGFDESLLVVKRLYSWTNHLYRGRNVGMQAVATPNKTSHVRQYQFGMLSHFCKCQSNTIFSICPQRDRTSRVIGEILIIENCPNERQRASTVTLTVSARLESHDAIETYITPRPMTKHRPILLRKLI